MVDMPRNQTNPSYSWVKVFLSVLISLILVRYQILSISPTFSLSPLLLSVSLLFSPISVSPVSFSLTPFLSSFVHLCFTFSMVHHLKRCVYMVNKLLVLIIHWCIQTSIFIIGFYRPIFLVILDRTQNCIWWRGSSSGDLGTMQYPFILPLLLGSI